MVDPSDFYRSAKILLKQGKDKALAICDQQATAMLRARDVEGHAAWLAIRKAVLELANDTPPPGGSIQ